LQWRGGQISARFSIDFNAIDAHGPRNILEALLAGIDEVGRDLTLHLSPGVLGDRDTTGFGDTFDPRRDVDAITEDVFAFDDDVTDVEPIRNWIGVDLVLPASCSRSCL
jgi:hypothetical protein